MCIAMVPLMFAVPMIGKLIDAKQTSIQAGRYATWESTVYPDRENASVLLKDRFFSAEDSVITSQPAELENNHLWGGKASTEGGLPPDTAVLIDEQSISMTTLLHKDNSGMKISSGLGSVIESAGNVLGAVSGGKWDFGKTALTRTEVQVAVKSNSWIDSFQSQQGCGGGLGCFNAHGAILVDGWSAKDQSQAKNRTRALVPAGALEPIGDIVSILGHIPVFEELKGMDDMFGHIDLRPLPAHAERGLERYQE